MKKAIALGLFDGLHIGHAAILEKTMKIAGELGFSPAVFCFKKSGERIITDEYKLEALGKMGIREVYAPDFFDIKNLSPREFFRGVLLSEMNAVHIICGEDFRFGKNAAGDVKTLALLCAGNGVSLSVLPDVRDADGVRISSTEIRRHIREGNMKKANSLLGYDFFISSPVIRGSGIGRTIKFPTVNQQIPPGIIIPKRGVYATNAAVNGGIYKSVTNIGVKPTVNQDGRLNTETHIIGFCGDLYGETVTLSFLDFIRDEMKFASIDELSAQIRRDILISNC